MTKEAVCREREPGGGETRGATAAGAGGTGAAPQSARRTAVGLLCAAATRHIVTRDRRLCLLLDARSYSCSQCCTVPCRSAVIFSDFVLLVHIVWCFCEL